MQFHFLEINFGSGLAFLSIYFECDTGNQLLFLKLRKKASSVTRQKPGLSESLEL